jgi:uncharacterized damage-inducible protein DinB
MTKTLRKGAVGAMMDEYERAAGELVAILGGLDDAAWEQLRDAETSDPDCRTIQTVMRHVVRAGFGYANYIRAALGIPEGRAGAELVTSGEVAGEVEAMLAYMAETLDGRWTMSDDEITAVKMTVRWGPTYDLEQLLEHAIVHVLRHRRQIERFLSEPQFTSHASAS